MPGAAARRIVGVAEVSGHIKDALGKRVAEDAGTPAGAQRRREAQPEVHAALWLGVTDSGGGASAQGAGCGAGFGGVAGLEAGQVAVVAAGSDGVAQERLEEGGGAEIAMAFPVAESGVERWGEEAEANPQAGGEGFGVSANVDHAIGSAGNGEGRRDILAREAHFAIRGVFEPEERMAGFALVTAEELKGLGFGGEGEGGAGWVLVIADGVNPLDAGEFAGAVEPAEDLVEVGGVESMRGEADAEAADAEGLGQAEEDEVGGVLDQDDIAGIAEALGGHGEHLLGAMGDQEAVGVIDRLGCGEGCVEAMEALGGQASEIGVSGGGAVLEGWLAGRGRAEQLAGQRADVVDGQRFGIRESGGERDEAWLIECTLHQPGDGRIGQAPGEGGSCVKRAVFHASGGGFVHVRLNRF